SAGRRPRRPGAGPPPPQSPAAGRRDRPTAGAREAPAARPPATPRRPAAGRLRRRAPWPRPAAADAEGGPQHLVPLDEAAQRLGEGPRGERAREAQPQRQGVRRVAARQHVEEEQAMPRAWTT